MLFSLAMRIEPVSTGYMISAPWLQAPVHAATFEEAYREALRLRSAKESFLPFPKARTARSSRQR